MSDNLPANSELHRRLDMTEAEMDELGDTPQKSEAEPKLKQHYFGIGDGPRCVDCGTTADDAPDQYCKPKYVPVQPLERPTEEQELIACTNCGEVVPVGDPNSIHPWKCEPRSPKRPTEEEFKEIMATIGPAASLIDDPGAMDTGGPLEPETEHLVQEALERLKAQHPTLLGKDFGLRSGPQFSGMSHEAGKALVREDPLAYSMLSGLQGPEGEMDRRYLLPMTQAIIDDIDSRLRFLEQRERERTKAEDKFCEEMEVLKKEKDK